MNLFLDSFWRALAYCVRPRVIALSFLPLVLMVALAMGLGYFYWEGALDWVRETLEASSVVNSMWSWLEGVGAGSLKMVLAPLIVIFAITPVIVVLSLLVVAVMMTPALTLLVAERRFPQLERKRGGSIAGSVFWSLGSTLLALIAMARYANEVRWPSIGNIGYLAYLLCMLVQEQITFLGMRPHFRRNSPGHFQKSPLILH